MLPLTIRNREDIIVVSAG